MYFNSGFGEFSLKLSLRFSVYSVGQIPQSICLLGTWLDLLDFSLPSRIIEHRDLCEPIFQFPLPTPSGNTGSLSIQSLIKFLVLGFPKLIPILQIILIMTQQIQQTHNNPTVIKVFHTIAFALMAYGYFWSVSVVKNWHSYIKYLTMQGFFVSFVTYFYYLIVIPIPFLLKRSISEKLFQLSFCLQVIITFGFWLILYYPMIKSDKFSDNEIHFNEYIHSVPLMLNIVDIVVINPKFHKKDMLIILVFTIFSISINAFYTLYHGPVYFFLTYKHYYQFVILALGALFILATHYLAQKSHHNREKKKLKNLSTKQTPLSSIKKHND